MPIITPQGQQPSQKTTATETSKQSTPIQAAPEAVQSQPPGPTAELKKPEAETKDETLSPKFLALARQQKAIRKMQQEIKEREDKLKAQEAEYQSNYIQKSKFKEDPMGVLSQAGMTYDDIVKAQLGQDPVIEALKPLESKISGIEQSMAKAQEEAVKKQQEDYDRAVEHVRSEAKTLIDSDPEFETIKASEAQEAVVDLIKETFEKDGKLLSVKEAAMMIENDLFEYAMKLVGLEKVKKKLAPAEEKANLADAVKKQQQQQQPAQQQVRTLTNASTVVPSRPLSTQERRERAIMAFRGQLPQT